MQLVKTFLFILRISFLNGLGASAQTVKLVGRDSVKQGDIELSYWFDGAPDVHSVFVSQNELVLDSFGHVIIELPLPNGAAVDEGSIFAIWGKVLDGDNTKGYIPFFLQDGSSPDDSFQATALAPSRAEILGEWDNLRLPQDPSFVDIFLQRMSLVSAIELGLVKTAQDWGVVVESLNVDAAVLLESASASAIKYYLDTIEIAFETAPTRVVMQGKLKLLHAVDFEYSKRTIEGATTVAQLMGWRIANVLERGIATDASLVDQHIVSLAKSSHPERCLAYSTAAMNALDNAMKQSNVLPRDLDGTIAMLHDSVNCLHVAHLMITGAGHFDKARLVEDLMDQHAVATMAMTSFANLVTRLTDLNATGLDDVGKSKHILEMWTAIKG